MSLSDSIIEIADQIEADVEGLEMAMDIQASSVVSILKGYIRQLRTAVKAATTDAGTGQSTTPFQNNVMTLPNGQQGYQDPLGRFHLLKPAKEPEEVKKADCGQKMVMMVGGNCDGTMVEIPGDLKPGHKAPFGGQVYVYREDGQIHYDEAETEKLRKPSQILTA
jgi:hypothetical protein